MFCDVYVHRGNTLPTQENPQAHMNNNPLMGPMRTRLTMWLFKQNMEDLAVGRKGETQCGCRIGTPLSWG